MTDQNQQQLPPGLERRAQNPQHQNPAPQAPQQPQYDQNYPQQPQAQPQPAPQEPPHNPMLSHMSAPPSPDQAVNQPPQAPAPQEPQAPKEPEKPAEQPKVVGDARALAGDFADDPNVSPALSYLEAVAKEKGLDWERAFGNANREGDPRFIDKAYLSEVFGDQADTVAQTAESVVKYSTAQYEKVQGEVYELAGGEQNWRQAAQYFLQNADPETQEAIKQFMDAGNQASRKYATKQILEFAKQGGATIHHQAQPFGSDSGVVGLSKDDYIKAITAERNISPERYAELRKQRELGKKQNL